MLCTGEGAHRDPAVAAAEFHRALEEIPRETAARVSANASRRSESGCVGGDECTLLSSPPHRVVPSWAGVISFGLLKAPGRWSLGRGGNAADVDALLRGLPGNVTTEMDLAWAT